jgi:hypothetical protein
MRQPRVSRNDQSPSRLLAMTGEDLHGETISGRNLRFFLKALGMSLDQILFRNARDYVDGCHRKADVRRFYGMWLEASVKGM